MSDQHVRKVNPFTIFENFVKPFWYRAYETNIFPELADNGSSGRSGVVGADSRKWGHFGGFALTPWLGVEIPRFMNGMTLGDIDIHIYFYRCWHTIA